MYKECFVKAMQTVHLKLIIKQDKDKREKKCRYLETNQRINPNIKRLRVRTINKSNYQQSNKDTE